MDACRALTAPVLSGTENLPDPLAPKRPLLFVGNHQQFGLYDLGLIMLELYNRGFKVSSGRGLC